MTNEKVPIFIFLCSIFRCFCSHQCSSKNQKDIFSTLQKCSSVPTVVNLRDLVQNSSDVLQVIPSYVTVNRCSGSCNTISYNCQPFNQTFQLVPIMMVMNRWPHGEHELICDEIAVSFHEECSCGCEVTPQECHPELQYHHQPSCR